MVRAILLLTLRWVQILGMLANEPAEDQFGQVVQWSNFSSKPFLLVIADHAASERALEIGAAVHTKYNGREQLAKQHL